MFKKPYNRSFDLPQNKLFCFSFVAAAFVCAVAGLIPKLQPFDSAVVQFLAGARNPFLNSLFLFLTSLGSPEFVVALAALLALFFLYRKDMAHFSIFAGTILGEVASVYILKDFVMRVRPTEVAHVYQETGFSFPSGHAAVSVVFYGLLAYLWAQNVKSSKARHNILFGLIFFIVMIGFSRVYLGVHYPSDVLAGYGVGAFWLCAGIIAFEQLFGEKKRFLFWKRS